MDRDSYWENHLSAQIGVDGKTSLPAAATDFETEIANLFAYTAALHKVPVVVHSCYSPDLSVDIAADSRDSAVDMSANQSFAAGLDNLDKGDFAHSPYSMEY